VKRAPKALRVLIIPDKFKGTLTAAAAAAAIARGWTQARPQDDVRTFPLTDGGDGFGDCMKHVLQARCRSVRSIDAAHRLCRVPWWFAPDQNLAIVESARCIGLAQLPPGRYHPFRLDTRGLAAVLQTIASRRTRTCLVGIGGSATNDGGFGLAIGLGWRFLDSAHRTIRRWIDLPNLATIVPPARPNPLGSMRLIVATDVENRLLGRHGATRVYGPQKGIRPGDVAPTERALHRLSAKVQKTFGTGFADHPGSGAAGGLGFGLMAFAGATLQSGIQLYARHARLDAHLEWAQLIITGEGKMDASTLMGKGVGEVARRARSRHLPCIGVAGCACNVRELERLFVSVQALTPDRFPLQDAMRRPGRCLRRLSFDLAASWQPPAEQVFVRPSPALP